MSTSDAIMDDGVYTEEDIKRSEEFKEKGNAYFKGKIYDYLLLQTTSLSKVLICIRRRFFARLHRLRNRFSTVIELWRNLNSKTTRLRSSTHANQ